MIVVDTSVFIDAIFRFDENRYELMRKFFRLVQNSGLSIIVPEVFKVELIGQLVRRTKRDDAFKIYNGITGNVDIVDIERIR